MKRKNLINKNVISALSIALSASMAILNPVAALADTDVENGAEESLQDIENGVADEAQEYADDTAEAVDSADSSVDTVVNDITETAEETGFAEVSEESVAAVIDVASDLAEDKSLENAASYVEDVKEDLIVAENADAKADLYAEEALKDVALANETANLAKAQADSAALKADELSENIKNASSVDEAKANFDELTKLSNDTKADLKIKKDAFEDYSKKFEKAVKELEAAEEKFDNSLGKASADVTAAKTELDNAKKKVETLETAVKDAKEDLSKEEAAAEDLVAGIGQLKSGDWNTKRVAMKAAVIDYIVPQIIGEGSEVISYSDMNKGFNGQDSSHVTVKYMDADKNVHEIFFNYDNIDRKYVEGNQWASLGSSKYITVYEKSAEEIAADDYAVSVYGVNARNKGGFQNDYKNGKYDVFAYEADGQTKFLMKEELDEKIADGQIEETDGTYYIDGNAIRKVQQTNAATSEGIKLNLSDDSDMYEFIEEAGKRVAVYERYEEEAGKAKEAVNDAIEEAEALEDAVDALKKNRSGRMISAAAALGTEDVASYLGIELSADKAAELNEMSLEDAIAFLNSLLSEAKGKVDAAEEELAKINDKLTAAEKDLNDIINRYAPKAEEAAGDAVEAVTAGSTDETVDEEMTFVSVQTTEGSAADVAADVEVSTTQANGNVLGLNRNVEAAETTVNEVKDTVEATKTFEEKKTEELKTIEGTKTALAGSLGIDEGDAKAMNWWWIILIIVFGTKAYEMYKKHQDKYEAVEAVSDEK